MKLVLSLYVLCFAVAPKVFMLADMERGYDAVGGEVFIFLIPIIVLLIFEDFKSRRKDNEKTNENGVPETMQVLQ